MSQKKTINSQSRRFKARTLRETPVIDTDQNIFLKSRPALQINTENQQNSSDEDKSVKRLHTQLSYSSRSQLKSSRNKLLLQKFDSEIYVGLEQIKALNKIYCEVITEEDMSKRFSRLIQYLEEKVPVFEPTFKAIIAWNILIIILCAFFFFEIPVFLAWGENFWTLILPLYVVRIFTSLSYIIFVMDIALQFVTTFYKRGVLIKNKSKIAINYIRKNFIYDIIAIFAFSFRVSFQSNQSAYFCLLFYFKLPVFLGITNQFDEVILLKRRLRACFQVGRFMFFMLLAFDLFACFFFILGTWSVNQGYNSWLTHTGGNFGEIDLMSPHEQYFFSYYISLVTMTSTMGYGDITPLNTFECSFCLCGILFGLMIFTTFLNYNYSIYEEFNESSLQVYKSRVSINRFMKLNNVPAHLSESVRQYLNQLWQQEGTRDLKLEQKTIAKLPSELREELMFNSYGKFLQETEMFKQNFSRPFLRALSSEIQEVSYSKGETVFRDRNTEQIDENCFYFIVNGSVIINPLKGTKSPEKTYLNKLRAGQHFGEWSFFTGMNRLASAQADSYSLMYYIKREDFLKILSRFDDDYERFCLMKDKLLIENDLSVIDVQCWTCGDQSHMSTHCTLTHYRPAVQKVVNQEVRGQDIQDRQVYERCTRLKWPSRLNYLKLVEQRRGRNLKVLGNYLENQKTKINKKSNFLASVYSPMNSRLRIPDSSFEGQQNSIEEFHSDLNVLPIEIKPESSLDQVLTFQQVEVKSDPDDSSSSNSEEERKSSNREDQQINFSEYKIPSIQEGLSDFDLPFNFKRYKIYQNKQNLWSINGELIKRT